MYSKRSNAPLLSLLLLAAVFVGCSSQKAWLYSVEPESSSAVLVDKSVAVPPFTDKRSNENSNMVLMYMVPLVPYGWQDLDAPEGTTMHVTSGLWLWRPNEDMAKAAAEELQASHMFKEVFFTNRQSEGELVLTGTIKSTNYGAKMFSYCLSVYGPLLWFFGFPASHTKNALEVSFSLKERQSQKLIWENTYSEEASNTSWIYYLGSDFNYSDLYKKIMLQAMKDIRASLPKSSG